MIVTKIPQLGILQGRLTPSPNEVIQFFPRNNWENEFVVAHNIGFDCMELLVKKDSCWENPLLGLVGVFKIRKLAQDYRISILSVHGFYDKSDDFVRVLVEIVRGASVLGAKTILVSFFGENSLKTDDDKNLVRDQFSGLTPYCQDAGIRLGIETEMAAFELRDFVLSLKNPNLGIYYDIGNMASMGVDVADEIRTLGDLICGIHVKDRLPDGGKTVPLGEGCTDFKSAFKALKDIGYGGPFIIQGARSSEVDDVVLNKRYFNFCRDLLVETYRERSAK